MGTAYDALLGRIWNNGIELELGGGLDFTGGLAAVLNTTTNRIEVRDLNGPLEGSTDGEVLTWDTTSSAWAIPASIRLLTNLITVGGGGGSFISNTGLSIAAGASLLTSAKLVLNGGTGAAGIDVGGAGPVRNFHEFISASSAQTVAASGTPGYIALQLDDTDTTVSAFSDLDVPVPVNGSVEPGFEIGFRVRWRDVGTGTTRYVDELSFNVDYREDGSSQYYVQAALVSTIGAGEGAAWAAAEVTAYSGTGATYKFRVQTDGQISLKMLQDASTARRVQVEVWRSSVRNGY